MGASCLLDTDFIAELLAEWKVFGFVGVGENNGKAETKCRDPFECVAHNVAQDDVLFLGADGV
jgi:hypothetical protein